MQLTVVVENQTSSQSLLAEWGYSAWLQTEDAVVLLDTGGIQHTLQHNLTALGLEAKCITDLVLDGHFDHTSGVMDVLRMAPDVRVWAAPGIGRERLGNADAKRVSGGGSMLTGLAFSPIDPFVEIVPGVIAFPSPPQHATLDGCALIICLNAPMPVKSFPIRLPMMFRSWCKQKTAPPCFWAARMPVFPTSCATQAAPSTSITSTLCSAARI